MTVMDAIGRADTAKPNCYSQEEKRRWLSVLDGVIRKEIVDTHEGAESTENADGELLVPHPYDEIYLYWLEARIDYANGEYGKYNNSISLFNAAFEAYEKYYRRTHMPKAKVFAHF